MAHFLRGKQAGIKNDLSAGLDPDSFAIDQVKFAQQFPPRRQQFFYFALT